MFKIWFLYNTISLYIKLFSYWFIVIMMIIIIWHKVTEDEIQKLNERFSKVSDKNHEIKKSQFMEVIQHIHYFIINN